MREFLAFVYEYVILRFAFHLGSVFAIICNVLVTVRNMIILRPEQRLALLNALRARRNKELAAMIGSELWTQANEIMKNRNNGQTESIILYVIEQCHKSDIVDADQIFNLSYIRIITNIDVFSMDAFSYLFNNDLMLPYAKARHLILSFFAINTLKQG